jgi:formylglycine-generating enzyme required for sulfatase activity
MDTTSPDSQALPPGTHLHEFVIERVLGTGGFGITYLARDTSLNRQVVIKENLPTQFAWRETATGTVRPRHSSGGDADDYEWSMKNFLREAETLASLDHHGIVRVLRKFETNGTAYFVMPFVDGVALDTLIEDRRSKNSPFSEQELRGLLERMLDALAYLHDRGIYHRDIKPGNILISNEGVPALIDFGSARQRLSERSMTVIESAGYTPFEQLQSRGSVGPWSDLYALGGTMCKLLTGDAPPKANDRAFDDPFIPLAERPELKAAYSSSFLRCLDRALCMKSANRWQDAGDWLAAMRESTEPSAIVVQLPPASVPRHEPVAPNLTAVQSVVIPEKKNNPLPWIVAACIVLVLVALAKTISGNKAENPSVTVTDQSRLQQERDKAEAAAARKAEQERQAGETAQREAKTKEDADKRQTEARTQQELERQRMDQARQKQVIGSKPGEEKMIEICPGENMIFCWIPPGEFMMGSPEGELGRGYKETQHKVVISKGFWMGKYEVTQSEWEAVMGNNPSKFRGDNLKLPVEQVSLIEISQSEGFLEKANKHQTGGMKFCLPTEDQWEYACRASTTTALNNRKNLTSEYEACAHLDEVAWYELNAYRTNSVGKKKPNSWGLHDMHGNVSEWCNDDVRGDLDVGVRTSQVQDRNFRPIRGGAWRYGSALCRSASLNSRYADEVNQDVGFRLVFRHIGK